MRKILLASAALVLSAGSAWADDTASVTITSSLDQNCEISNEDTTAVLDKDAVVSTNREFDTECNYSLANLTLNFKSAYGGLKNLDEPLNPVRPYKLTYLGTPYASGTALLGPAGQNVVHAAGGTVTRNYDLLLDSALAVAGDYEDILTISVSP